MIEPRRLAFASPVVRPMRLAQRSVRRHHLRHHTARGRRTSPARALDPISLWLDDRRALPLKWALLALVLLGVALLEVPL